MKSNIIRKAIDEEDVNNRNIVQHKSRTTVSAGATRIDFGSSARSFAEAATRSAIEDPSIYDYDGVYDEMKRQKDEIAQEKRAKHKTQEPVLLQQRLEALSKRERQVSIAIENVNKKQMKREGHSGDTQEFVTKSYLAMKQANEKYAREEEQNEEFNKQHTSNMSGFLKGMFQQNLYHGGERVDVNSEMQKRQQQKQQLQQQQQQQKAGDGTGKKDATGSARAVSRSRSRERERKQRAPAPAPEAVEARAVRAESVEKVADVAQPAPNSNNGDDQSEDRKPPAAEREVATKSRPAESEAEKKARIEEYKLRYQQRRQQQQQPQ